MKKCFSFSLLFLFPLYALAHHGHNSQFDVNKIIEVNGVITKIGFVNPHAYVYFDVTDDSGEVVNWHCEMRAASVLKRSGWTKEMFSPGETIKVVGIASRREANGCYVETVSLGGGEAIARYDQLEENKREVETKRPEKTAWGVPYIAGDWAAEQRLIGAVSGESIGNGPGGPGGGRRGGATIQYTEAGLAALDVAKREASDGVSGRLDCQPRDFFRDWTFDQPANLIIQEEDTITLKYGFMDTVRTIHIGMEEHPTEISPSFAGHSIGSWEGNTLVVDTVGFKPVVTRARGAVSGVRSEEFHAVERFTLDTEKGSLTRSYVADDPRYWQAGQQQSGEDVVYLSDYPWEPYECDDLTVE